MKTRLFGILGDTVAFLDPYAGRLAIFLISIAIFIAPAAVLHRRILFLVIAISVSVMGYALTHVATAVIKIANALQSKDGRSKTDA